MGAIVTARTDGWHNGAMGTGGSGGLIVSNEWKMTSEIRGSNMH